jgi:hypothetical protein
MAGLMSTRRSIIRRIAKYVAVAAAVPVLLLSGYICAWLLWTWWLASGVSSGGVIVIHPAFEPIHHYIAVDWPGARLLDALWQEVIQRSLPRPMPLPEPAPPVMEDIDRLLMDVPQ